MRRPVPLSFLATGALIVALAMPATAYPRPGRTERVSVAPDGTQGDEGSSAASLSADGRLVAFASADTNLVPGDANDGDDVLLVDRLTRTIRRLSVSSDGTQANDDARGPALSADGRYVAFISTATNLVPDKTNICPTIFGPAPCQDVFVHDRGSGATERVSLASDGVEANGSSSVPVISADGRFVAFPSTASNLVTGDTNVCSGPLGSASCQDIFVHDRETGLTERVSVASDGTEANNESLGGQAISADGRYVVFTSSASNLVAGDSNQTYDVFVHDRETGVTQRVSVASDGAQANSTSAPLGIRVSADGRYVAFQSTASNLVTGDTNGRPDIFVRDRLLGVTERVSVASDGAQGNWDGQQPAISADGRYVVFGSLSSTLVPSDTNDRFDIFVRDRGPDIGVGGITLSDGDAAVEVSGWATFSGAVLASAADPPDDGGGQASSVGGELTGAVIAQRAEQEDLLVTLDVTRLPTVQLPLAGTVAGSPGVLYGLEFRVAGVRYEVRAIRAGTTAVPPAAPLFALYRCDPVCAEAARLSGGFGTTGQRIEVALPLAAIGAGPGSALTGIRAFTARGEAGTGAIEELDEIDLPSSTLVASTVTLGIGSAAASEKEVTFQAPVGLEDGHFVGTLDVSGLGPGNYRVWVRGCLGEICSSASSPNVFGVVVVGTMAPPRQRHESSPSAAWRSQPPACPEATRAA